MISRPKGRGECRVPAAPIASRAKVKQAHERSHHRYSRIHPAFPHAMVLTVTSCSPRRSGLFVTVACGLLRRLDAGVEASGPHDFAVRKQALSSAAPAASTASRPASVTIAIRPFVGWDRESYSFDLGFGKTEIFLQMGLDRQMNCKLIDLPVGQINGWRR
jgi:hypothetical protein